jgi:DNA repair ATPase RecN
MKTKHQVIQLIVDLSEENEQMVKNVLGNAVVEGAKEALNSMPDIKTLKIIAETITFLAKCIEDLEKELKEMKAHNERQGVYLVYRDNDIKEIERLIRKYYESLNKILREI